MKPPALPATLATLGIVCWALLPGAAALWGATADDAPGGGATLRWVAGALVLVAQVAWVVALRRPTLGRTLGSAVVVLGALATGWARRDDPLIALLLLIFVWVVGVALWGWLSPGPPRRRPGRDVSAGAAVVLWSVVALAGFDGLWARVALVGGLVSAAIASYVCTLHAGRPVAHRRALLALGLAALPALPWLTAPHLWALPALAAQLSTIPAGPARRWLPRGLDRALDAMLLDPAVTVLATFLGGGLLGTVLLALPLATEGGGSLDLIDAAFTAFSAICVTGLGVVDTPNTFGPFGEATLLMLIQVGGLGIMTLSTAALTFLGRRLSVRHEVTAAELLQAEDRRTMAKVLRRILLVTGLFEGAGAAALTTLFWIGGDAPAQALWRGVFTAISAFCNAGFALQSDSLVGYQSAPLVLLTVGLLIVVGGLGPAVIAACWGWRRGGQRLSVAARLVLWTSLALTLIGFGAFLSLEWRGTLAHLGPLDRVANALFQSITLRTAGFNSIDLAACHPATIAVMLPLMFVGGSPASTAGGIKTTTLAVLLLLLRASFGRAERVRLMGRSLRPETTHKAAAVAFLGFASVFGTLLMLLATQSMRFDVALFEAVSALGTVGLTIGGTGALDLVGKVVVIVAMFAGRVGPLTLLIVIGRRGRVGAGPGLPPIEVDVG